MKLTVFGATGRTGLQVVEQGLAAGHQIRAVVRDATGLAPDRAGLDVIVADVMDPATIVEAVTGSRRRRLHHRHPQRAETDHGVRRHVPQHRRRDAQSRHATPGRRQRHRAVRRG